MASLLALLDISVAKDRRMFRRRAILHFSEVHFTEVKTVDIDPHGINVMHDSPMTIGEHCSIAFNVTVDRQLMPLRLKTTVISCVLAGQQGFRIYLTFAKHLGEAERRHVRKIINLDVY